MNIAKRCFVYQMEPLKLPPMQRHGHAIVAVFVLATATMETEMIAILEDEMIATVEGVMIAALKTVSLLTDVMTEEILDVVIVDRRITPAATVGVDAQHLQEVKDEAVVVIVLLHGWMCNVRFATETDIRPEIAGTVLRTMMMMTLKIYMLMELTLIGILILVQPITLPVNSIISLSGTLIMVVTK
jgi:hypothetical protein